MEKINLDGTLLGLADSMIILENTIKKCHFWQFRKKHSLRKSLKKCEKHFLDTKKQILRNEYDFRGRL